MPDSTIKSLKSLNIDANKIVLESIKNHNFLKPGNKLNNQGILFKKIDIK